MDQNSQNGVCIDNLKNHLAYLNFGAFYYKMHILFFQKMLIILR